MLFHLCRGLIAIFNFSGEGCAHRTSATWLCQSDETTCCDPILSGLRCFISLQLAVLYECGPLNVFRRVCANFENDVFGCESLRKCKSSRILAYAKQLLANRSPLSNLCVVASFFYFFPTICYLSFFVHPCYGINFMTDYVNNSQM